MILKNILKEVLHLMDSLKKLVGEKSAEYVKDGMIVGLGTGSTAHFMIVKIGEMVKAGLDIKAVATSKLSEETARQVGIPIVEFKDVDRIDLAIDGADEIDENLNLIKGGGGALLREKIIEQFSEKLVIIADESKNVDLLGDFTLPVEVIQFASELTKKEMEKLGCKAVMRVKDGQAFITDSGNIIFDCDFGKIENPADLCKKLNEIPGVVENGLFPNMADIVLIGKKDGTVEVIENTNK